MSQPTKPTTKPNDLKVPRVSFVQLASLQSLAEINNLNETDILELCQQFPKAAAQLIIDLNTEWGLSVAKVGELKAEVEKLRGAK